MPRAVYASNACRKRAFDRKKQLEKIEPVTTWAVAVEQPSRSQGSPLEQLSQAILEARVLTNVFMRLGHEADPKIGWRASEVGKQVNAALTKYFPFE